MNSLVGLIILIGGLIVLRMLAQKFLSMTTSKIRLFILAYVGILLLSLPLSYFISFNQDREAPLQLLDQSEEVAVAYFKAIHDGNPPATEQLRELRHWKVPYEGGELTISSNDQSESIWVLVGRQQQSGQEINMTYYTTPYVVNQIDYTHLFSSPDVHLANDDLVISARSTSFNLNFVGLRKDLYITRFIGDDRDSGLTLIKGNGFLYIEAPPHLEIDATDGISLIFVED